MSGNVATLAMSGSGCRNLDTDRAGGGTSVATSLSGRRACAYRAEACVGLRTKEHTVNREQLDRYRKQLRSLLDRVRGTAAGLEETVRTPTGGEAAGGISNAPIHLGDVGSEAYSQELNATLLENEAYIRDEAAAALERIDRGTYGKCENCGKDIIHERLDAIPYARHCTPCAGKLQEGAAVNLNNGRPA